MAATSSATPCRHEENFPDRWGAEPDRTRKFFEWVEDLKATLEAVHSERGGLKALAARIERSFAVYPAEAIGQLGSRLTGDRQAGRLSMAASGLVGASGVKARDHTFHGEQSP